MAQVQKNPNQGLNAAVAASVRAELAAQKKTHAWLAEVTGHPKISVGRYLRAVRPIPLPVIEDFAIALGVTPERLMGIASRRLSDDPDGDLWSRLSPSDREALERERERFRSEGRDE